jgi:hypothetical protein
MPQKIFLIKVDHTECYVRADSEESLAALLTQYGVTKFTITRAPGKSKVATSVIECVREKLRKRK